MRPNKPTIFQARFWKSVVLSLLAVSQISANPLDVAPSGMISGGGILCPGYCTEPADDLIIDINGGTGPYVASIEVSILGFSITLDFPALLTNGTISLCVDPDAFFPYNGDFNGDGVDDIVVPNAPVNFSLELLGVTDDTGCVGTGSGIIFYDIQVAPTADDPDIYELCEGMDFDLTSFDSGINGSEPIEWYTDSDLQNQITNTSNYSSSSTPETVYAVANDGTCRSEIVNLELITIPLPMIDPIMDLIECQFYEFPAIDGTDIGPVSYYEDALGNIYNEGDLTMDSGTYTAIAGDNPNCMDMVSFEIEILPMIFILEPFGMLEDCGSIELPPILLDNLLSSGSFGYFSEPDGMGVMYEPGDFINVSDGLTGIYIFATNGPGCDAGVFLNLNFLPATEYIIPVFPTEECGDYTLLDIGNNTGNVHYYTEPMGGGTEYDIGDIITAPATYTLYIYDPTADQTCILNSDESFTITLEAPPSIDPLMDVVVCDPPGYILPDIAGTNLTGEEGYYTLSGSQGMNLSAGDTIFQTQAIFISSTNVNCAVIEQVFFVTVSPVPNSGQDFLYATCIGPSINMLDLLGDDVDSTGYFTSTDIVLEGSLSETFNTTLGTVNSSYTVQYITGDPIGVCGLDTSEIVFTLTSDITAGIPLPDTTVCSGTMINLLELLDGETQGGYFIDSNNPTEQILIPVWVAGNNSADFEYVIEPNGPCNGDMSSFSVNVIQSPSLSMIASEFSLCPGECTEIVIEGSEAFNVTIQYEIPSSGAGDGILMPNEMSQTYFLCYEGANSFFNQDTFFINENEEGLLLWNIEEAITTSQSIICQVDFLQPTSIEFLLSPGYEEEVIETPCNGEGVIYDGQLYFDDQEFVLQSVAGCDSITRLIIQELPVVDTLIEGDFCIGTPIMIAGEIFTTDTTTTIILNGASANACDSIINIDLRFDNASYAYFEGPICPEQTILINGEMYGMGNSTDSINLINGSVLNCDSIIIIDLEFYPDDRGIYLDTICPSDSINFFGFVFHEGMDSGVATIIDGSSNGCDSLIDVAIEFFEVEEMDMMYEKCEGDTLLIGDFVISDDNLSGSFTEESNLNECPTIINYITTNYTSSVSQIDTLLCASDTLEILGDLLYQGNDMITALVPGGNSNGCDSMVIVQAVFEQLNAGIDPKEISQNEFQLTAMNLPSGAIPNWSSSGNLSCLDCDNPTIIILEDTEVVMSYMSDIGCQYFTTILLIFVEETIIEEPTTEGIYFPNVFTPDSDTGSENFMLLGKGEFMILELFIFDRWGGRVYAANDFMLNEPSIFWDGRSNGQDVLPGVYPAIVRYLDPMGEIKSKVFDITLLR